MDDLRQRRGEEELAYLREQHRDAVTRHKDERDLRKRYARSLLVILGVQLGIADAVFLVYGFSNDWKIPVEAIDGWLAAVVIQVVGIVTIIVRYLFPSTEQTPIPPRRAPGDSAP